jgi:hypothetical protein
VPERELAVLLLLLLESRRRCRRVVVVVDSRSARGGFVVPQRGWRPRRARARLVVHLRGGGVDLATRPRAPWI